MSEKNNIGKILTLLIVGFGGLGLGYYSLQGHMVNKLVSVVPFCTSIACFIEIFNLNKKNNNKNINRNKTDKISKQSILNDLRLYYILALFLILIYPPMNYYETTRFYIFDGWNPITYLTGGDISDKYELNLTYLGIEFLFITIVFLLFYKKKN